MAVTGEVYSCEDVFQDLKLEEYRVGRVGAVPIGAQLAWRRHLLDCQGLAEQRASDCLAIAATCCPHSVIHHPLSLLSPCWDLPTLPDHLAFLLLQPW